MERLFNDLGGSEPVYRVYVIEEDDHHPARSQACRDRTEVALMKVCSDDPLLSHEEMKALQRACAPAGALSFPSPEIIRALRRHGYIEIVIGGVQTTQKGIERLLRERSRRN